jgi:hypothetical protein
MPAAQVAALQSSAMRDLEPALASGYLDRVVEIVTPFSSDQIGRFAGQIMGKLAGASNLVP